MRGDNSFFIIITPKDSKQAFREAENWIGREFISTLCFHRSAPPPLLVTWAFSIHPIHPNIQPLPPHSSVNPPPPPLLGIGPMMTKIVITPPPLSSASPKNEGGDGVSGR